MQAVSHPPSALTSLLLWALVWLGGPGLLSSAEPFDYFRNSWQVIGLKDYKDGTRVTPQNELLLGGNRRLRFAIGPDSTPLSQRQVKALLDGWLPVVLLETETNGARYHFTLWATPLPTVKNWQAAFDGPVEGENYLNWVKVRVTNLTAKETIAHVRFDLVSTNATRTTPWTAPLAPGRSIETVFRVPFAPVSDTVKFDQEKPERWLDRTVQYWRGVLAQGARIEVPCPKATQTLKAAHVCQLIASDHGELHAGEGFYDEFYIRDGGYQLLELEEAGLWGPTRKGLEAYLRSQRSDGRFESQKDQLDANGQALWTFWQYWKIAGDHTWLRWVYPQMLRAAEWVKTARRQAPSESPWTGLLPAAVADGEYLWDGKHHIVGYDLWNLRGLLCAADAARFLRKSADAAALETEAQEYRRSIDAACRRIGLAHFPPSWEKVGTPWGNTETLWPTELFKRDDPRVTATLSEVRTRHGGGFVEGTIRWTGLPNVIHPYLSSYTTMASLVRGEHEQFAEEFYWYLLHSSASHAFPEGVFFKRRYAWSETIPHVLGAANFAFMLRHALVHERGDELHLLLGAPDWWLAEGQEILVENAPTHFGPMSLRVRGSAKGVQVKLDPPRRSPPGRVVLHLPEDRASGSLPKNVVVARRSNQSRRWDFPTVVALYESEAARPAKPIPGLSPLPLTDALAPERCQFLELAPLANTDPFTAPFGVPKPGRFLFTGLKPGVQVAGGVPFRLIDPAQNQGRGLIVLGGAGASAAFPREIEVPVKAEGRRLFLLGNVHGYSPDDEGAGAWGAVAEYVIHYADGQMQSVPLISHRTADDWAMDPDASEAVVAMKGDPWHLNALAVQLRPVRVEKIVFRDLGTPAAPVLAAVTLEK
jgi:hypothetical protein